MVRVTLETVTPLFLGGADPRKAPELRPPSFRGALRFWWRALVGGVVGDDDGALEVLRKAESKLFGSTETGASLVVVRVSEVGGAVQVQEYRPLLHNPGKRFVFEGIKPGQPITVTFAPRPPHTSLPPAALWTLLVFILLGGLGRRSRRGFGSLMLRSPRSPCPEFPLLPDYSGPEGFCKSLSSLLQEALRATKEFVERCNLQGGSFSKTPRFSLLGEQYAKVLFCKQPFPGWEEAMQQFWGLLRSSPYRDNPIFGFAGSAGRQGSPLHLRILRLGDKYHILLTAFRVGFRRVQPDWKVMQSFLDRCQKSWNGVWIFGGGTRW